MDIDYPKLLIVEDEKRTRSGLVMALAEDYEVYEASDVLTAINILENEPIDIGKTSRLTLFWQIYGLGKSRGLIF